jgi:hypothetical protein
MVDPRLEAARRARAQMQAQSRLGLQFSPLQRFQQPVRRAPAGTREEALQRLAAAAGANKPKPGGARGVLGAVLGNPVAKTILKPLEVLDLGRRGAVLGVEEIASAISGKDYTPDGQSNWDKLRDPTYGFGDLVGSTGNKWVDRGIGFLGDVGLDPLTYLTLGTGKLAGAGGRLTAAGRLAAEGFGEETVQRAGRLGVNALNTAEREAIGAGQAGLRFAGARVPGTQTLAEVLGTTMAKGRAAVGDTVLGGAVRGRRGAPELREATEKLFTGRGTPSAVEAAEMVNLFDAKRMTGRTLANEFGHAHRELTKGMDDNTAVATTHAIEAGVAGDLPDAGRTFFADVRAGGRAKSADIGDLGPNYVPHLPTREFVDAVQGNEQLARELSSTFQVDLGRASGRTQSRQIVPGTYTFRGQTVDIVDGTIRELNQKLTPLLGFKPYEDDFRRLSAAYVTNVAEDAGLATGLKTVANSKSGVGEFADQAQLVDVVDTAATKKAGKQQVANWGAVVNGSLKRQRELTKGARKRVDQASREGRKLIDDAGAAHPLDEPLRALERVTKQRANPETAAETRRLAKELSDTAQAAGVDAEWDPVFQLLDASVRQLDEVERIGWSVAAQRGFLRAAKSGDVTPVLRKALRDGWEQIGDEVLAEGDRVVLTSELANMLTRVDEAITSKGLWRVVDEYTKFFKTYATMSPGFHFRNLMSATFMNYADGAKTEDMLEAIKLWGQYRKDPQGFLNSIDQPTRDAFEATFGSGAGGNFSAAELGDPGRFGRLSDNPVTRASRAAGEWVEGPVRLALALNTIKAGGTAQDALARVTRIHFDYSQLSNFDRKMKQLVPFWTFMSRNLPLQLQQMWLKPKSYAHYQSLVRNLDQGQEGDIVPLSWQETGAFKVGSGVMGGDDLYLAPDLPHVRLKQEVEKLGDPQRFLADFNPAIRVPFETMVADRKMFTGNEFRDDENKLLYALLNMVPPVAQAQRVAGVGDYYEDRQLQSVGNYLGLPVRQLTPQALEAELRRLAREQ